VRRGLFGAAGAWGQCAPSAPWGASVRPLNFTVRGHMLGWRELTRGQRIGGVFLLTLFIVASPFLVFVVPTSFGERLWHAGLVASGFGAILDPQSFRLTYGKSLSFATMPRVCRILVGVGVALVVLGLLMCYLPRLKG
jgi:hypothetical protein